MIFTHKQSTPLRRLLDTAVLAFVFWAPFLQVLFCYYFACIASLLAACYEEIAAERRGRIALARTFGRLYVP